MQFNRIVEVGGGILDNADTAESGARALLTSNLTPCIQNNNSNNNSSSSSCCCCRRCCRSRRRQRSPADAICNQPAKCCRRPPQPRLEFAPHIWALIMGCISGTMMQFDLVFTSRRAFDAIVNNMFRPVLKSGLFFGFYFGDDCSSRVLHQIGTLRLRSPNFHVTNVYLEVCASKRAVVHAVHEFLHQIGQPAPPPGAGGASGGGCFLRVLGLCVRKTATKELYFKALSCALASFHQHHWAAAPPAPWWSARLLLIVEVYEHLEISFTDAEFRAAFPNNGLFSVRKLLILYDKSSQLWRHVPLVLQFPNLEALTLRDVDPSILKIGASAPPPAAPPAAPPAVCRLRKLDVSLGRPPYVSPTGVAAAVAPRWWSRVALFFRDLGGCAGMTLEQLAFEGGRRLFKSCFSFIQFLRCVCRIGCFGNLRSLSLGVVTNAWIPNLIEFFECSVPQLECVFFSGFKCKLFSAASIRVRPRSTKVFSRDFSRHPQECYLEVFDRVLVVPERALTEAESAHTNGISNLDLYRFFCLIV